MKYFNILVFSFLFLNINISIRSSYITFPFKTSTKETKVYPDNFLQNDIEITLNIGNPPQSIDLNLRSKTYTFFATSIEANLPYQTFNDSDSRTLIKETNNPDNYGLQEYTKGYKIYDSIYIGDKEYKNISLILAISVSYRESGALGLRLVDSHEFGDDLSFIYQMKKLANLHNYAFTLKYNNNDEGELIIGAYPHIYDNKYNEHNFYYTKAGAIGNNVDWILNFDVIQYDNKTINLINRQGLIKIEYGLIQAPFKLKKYFKDNFFNDKCIEMFNSNKNITIVHCDENFNITNFKNLTFILKDINFEFILTYEDLFIKQNKEYIFGIVFDEDEDNKDATWILGKLFMKKYQLIYDLDRKIIGLYKENYDENKKNKNLIYIILLIILGVIIIVLVIFIVCYIKKPRKNRACELKDDDYDYFPNE